MTTPLTHVSPGDVISASVWNGMVDSINDMLIRLQHLEDGGVAGDHLSVTQLLPAGPYRVGDVLQIQGHNFQYAAGAARVFFNATQVLGLLPSSTDSLLVFQIPSVPGVLESGTAVELTVLNQAESVKQQVTLRPKLTALQGNVTLEWQSVTPATVLAGQVATFVYRLTSGTNKSAVWALTAVVDVAANAAAWNSQLRVLDALGTELNPRQIALDPGQQLNVQVQIPSVPGGTNGTSFGVTLSAAAESINGSSGIRQFVVGTPTPPPDATMSLQTVPGLSPKLSGNTLSVQGGQSSTLAISATLTVAGTYNITRSVLGGVAGWAVNLDSGTIDSFQITAADLSNGGSTTRLLHYAVSATAAAATPAQIDIRVQRQGNTSFRSITLNTVRT
jgi:hypothetical protein